MMQVVVQSSMMATHAQQHFRPSRFFNQEVETDVAKGDEMIPSQCSINELKYNSSSEDMLPASIGSATNRTESAGASVEKSSTPTALPQTLQQPLEPKTMTKNTHHGFDKDWVQPMKLSLVCSKDFLKCSVEADELASNAPKRLKVNTSHDIDEKHNAKDNEDEIRATSKVSTKRRNRKGKNKGEGKRCKFNEVVDVMPIPMRSEYSQRVRSRLWSTALEIHRNATRNAFEFASEGWNWRTVTEDEGMFVDVNTGELIHPIHYCEDIVFVSKNNDVSMSKTTSPVDPCVDTTAMTSQAPTDLVSS